MGLGQGAAIASFPEDGQLDRLTAHLLGTALPPLQSLTRGDLFWASYSTQKFLPVSLSSSSIHVAPVSVFIR